MLAMASEVGLMDAGRFGVSAFSGGLVGIVWAWAPARLGLVRLRLGALTANALATDILLLEFIGNIHERPCAVHSRTDQTNKLSVQLALGPVARVGWLGMATEEHIWRLA